MSKSEGFDPTDFGSVEDHYNKEKAMDNGQCAYCGGALVCVGLDGEDATIICSACKQEA